MQLGNNRLVCEQTPDQRYLSFEIIEIIIGATLVARCDLVTGAVIADRVTERDMNVQGQGTRTCASVACLDRGNVGIGHWMCNKPVCGRIGRVPRTVSVVTSDQFRIKFQRGDMCRMHDNKINPSESQWSNSPSPAFDPKQEA